MKRIFAAIISAAMLVSASMPIFAAGELGSVTVSSNKATVPAKTFVTGNGEMGEININDVMTEVGKVTATKEALQTLKIKSTVAPMDFWLKLELPEASGYNRAEAYTAIDYYQIKITDENDRVLYDDGKNENSAGNMSRYIHIAENTKNKKESSYNLYISANKNVDLSALSSKTSDIEWKLVYTDDEKKFQSASAPSAVPTVTATEAPTGTPRVSPAPTATAAPSASASASAGKRVEILVTSKSDGKNVLKPGTYKMVGKGTVTVFNKDGASRFKGELFSSNDDGLIVTVAEGEKILLEGDSSAYIQFKSPNAAASAKASATAKATTKPTASAKATAKATATAKANTVPSAAPKNNPKTGDFTPIAGLCALAFLSLGTIIYVLADSKKKLK